LYEDGCGAKVDGAGRKQQVTDTGEKMTSIHDLVKQK
jgi:hypothetical protein